MDVGAMRHRVIVQTLVSTVDEYGEPVPSWLDTATRRAAIRTPTGKDKVNADQLKVQLSQVVTMRYRSDVDATNQIVYEGRTFRITYVVDRDERHREMDLYCVELIDGAGATS